MERQDAIHALTDSVKNQLSTAQNAYQASHASVTSAENKQEGKYDTRGLEESYLANGLAVKVTDLEAILTFLDGAISTPTSEIIVLGSLILGRQNNEAVVYFLAPKGGGIDATVKGKEVMIITAESPIGNQLLGKKAGESTTAPPFYVQEVK